MLCVKFIIMFCEWESATHGLSIKYRHTQHPFSSTRPSVPQSITRRDSASGNSLSDVLETFFRGIIEIQFDQPSCESIQGKWKGSCGRPTTICYMRHEFQKGGPIEDEEEFHQSRHSRCHVSQKCLGIRPPTESRI